MTDVIHSESSKPEECMVAQADARSAWTGQVQTAFVMGTLPPKSTAWDEEPEEMTGHELNHVRRGPGCRGGDQTKKP